MLSLNLQITVRLVYCAYNLLIINLANLRSEIGTTVPRIVDLLSNNNRDVRNASVNALSKFAEHGKIGLF